MRIELIKVVFLADWNVWKRLQFLMNDKILLLRTGHGAVMSKFY